MDRVGTALYRFFDHDGQLLYVGVTSDPWRRFAKHQRTTWACEVDVSRTTVHWFDSRGDAMEQELAAIRSEHPVFNSTGTPYGYTPPVPPTLQRLVEDLAAERIAVEGVAAALQPNHSEWFGLRWRNRAWSSL